MEKIIQYSIDDQGPKAWGSSMLNHVSEMTDIVMLMFIFYIFINAFVNITVFFIILSKASYFPNYFYKVVNFQTEHVF